MGKYEEVSDATNSGILRVGDANSLGQLSRSGITPTKDGYFYTYGTNNAFARYTSGFISQVGTSVPGVGLQVGSLHHTAMFTNYLAGSPTGFIFAGVMVNSLHSAGVALFGLTNAWDYFAQIGGFRPYTIWTR